MAGLGIAVFLGLWLSRAQTANVDAEVEALISALTTFGSPGAGIHPTASVSQFIAIDEEPVFRGGIIGSQKPYVDPTMRKLVQIGVPALPKLLEHLSDQRPTGYTQEHGGGFGAMWFAAEYSPRWTDPKKVPTNVNRRDTDLANSISSYTFTVGDLCFTVVGQIVNRRLNAMRYQPSACIVINSPTRMPELAAATRSDWAGLTPKAHALQLVEDTNSEALFGVGEALKRLLFYYPPTGESVVLKLLRRPLYDDSAMWKTIEEPMMATGDPKRWRALLAVAQRKFGPESVKLIPRWIYRRTRPFQFSKAENARAQKILLSVFPDYSPHRSVYCNAARVYDQMDVVESIAAFANSKIDTAVHATFARALRWSAANPAGDKDAVENRQHDLDRFALVCATRPTNAQERRAYIQFFKRRVQSLQQSPRGSQAPYYRKRMVQALQTLEGAVPSPSAS